MKKILVVALVVAVTLIGASSAMALIANSKHDLSTTSTATIKGTNGSLSSCQFCHTPHLGTNPSNPLAPLWNRSGINSSGYNATDGSTPYQVYGAIATGSSGTTLSGSQVLAPGPNSKTCLSCHDGTVALGNVLVGSADAPTTYGDYSPTRLTSGRLTGGGGAIGTDLTQEHPVGVVYQTGNKAGLNTVINTNNEINNKKWKIYGGGIGTGKVECGSCHDPHNTTAGQVPFLKDTKGTMCSDCHSAK